MLTIAADPKHLGAQIGFISVLHTWGSAMTHHPHIHMIVPGGGISPEGKAWIACRPNFFLSVTVLPQRFRRRFLEMLLAAHRAGRLQFFNEHAPLAKADAFADFLAPLRDVNWVVHAKPPARGGPETVLSYLSRYTHRVAISNSWLIALDDSGVTFTCKDYRRDGAERYGTMTLTAPEFIRRFLIHVLPKGFHRIRNYGLFANATRAANIARARELLGQTPPVDTPEDETTEDPDTPRPSAQACPCCGGAMIIIEVFEPGCQPKHRPIPEAIDSS